MSFRAPIAPLLVAAAALAALTLLIGASSPARPGISCEQAGGMVPHEGLLRRGFKKRRWRDPTPLRRGERRRLNAIQR
ncbi:MAG: hypothetical protein ACRDL6_09915, partial [Solirubrobacterales bacterium]